MTSFNGKLFGYDIALAGEERTAHFSSNALHIDGFSPIPVNRLSCRVGGFNHNELFFHWQDEQQNNCSFMPNSQSEIKTAASEAPAELQPQLKQWHFRKRSISVIWTSIISVVVITLLATILLWWQYDKALTWVTTHISIKNEQALGETIFTQMQTDIEFITDGTAHTTVVQIGTLLSKNSAYEYQWHIAKDSQINAYALPGGIIIVNSGLLTAIDSPDELAAVLAHEIQHVEQRHTLKNMVNSMGWAAGMLVLLGDINVATAVVVHQLGNLYFGREKEEEADNLGLDLLVANNINPNGMLVLMQRLDNENNVELPEWLSSHPTTSDRINHIETQIDAKQCDNCQSLDYDWDTIKDDPRLSN